ncbi:hypothetical protein RJT34_14905 [Clitoria ternatea]|uniref:Uncharacterized protein n=1 Tax=Clitoria ternatea TaxID=43366 RepID=A0AAN9JTL6_CLITE
MTLTSSTCYGGGFSADDIKKKEIEALSKPIDISLGMCKRCGNLRRLACSTCRGTRLVKEWGILSMKLVEDLYETLGVHDSKGILFYTYTIEVGDITLMVPSINLQVYPV